MLQITILTVGRIKEKYLQDGIKEYSKRLNSYVRLKILEVDDEPCPEKASAAEEEKVRQKEGEKLLKLISSQDFVVLLDLQGKVLTSPEVGELMEGRALAGQSRITFIIGGSLGTADEVRKRADFRWSFSMLTFPHQLIRLMLLEQIYRACKINKGETYHK
ncbi:23S rRNA (pseudouridine(1915)-N(3))-methyltransferase RlmH [Dehalobacter sp. DCM]|uniref:23S rRNA (pseudouridine(1915)-N(3))-methyltransferase RlmH n=1 Tax=Dehalobacter sp. DCM TaxID=2907827 RepID=UPI003FCEB159|nr:23S rRNA (pseudouridine(1915)-N(3))-methyltransferase RlmH [Dehalobacter sp. DCM]